MHTAYETARRDLPSRIDDPVLRRGGDWVEPLARIELAGDAPAEVLRLMPLVGLDPVLLPPLASTPSRVLSPESPDQPIMLSVEFAQHPRAANTTSANADPVRAALTIGLDSAAPGDHWIGDLSTDSATAAVCLVLSRALGLAPPFLTGDPDLFDVIRAAIAVAPGSAPVLVEGEIAVGKESLIKLIHAASRNPIALVHAECAGLDANAMETEFAPLLAMAADGASTRGRGAIFFNRIGELAPAAQRKLLDLLRNFAPAAPEPVTDDNRSGAAANLRIFAASTHSPAAAPPARELLPELRDLFDLTLTIPPLRARRGDVSLLARYYLHSLNSALTLDAPALRALSSYPFPGNVRELTNFVTRLAIAPPKARTRRSNPADPSSGIVRRSDIISQLESRSLKTIWQPRDRQNLPARRSRKKIPAPVPVASATGAQTPPAADPSLPASLRLTPTTTAPRTRKPRGGRDRQT